MPFTGVLSTYCFLDVNKLVIDNFLGTVADRIHLLNPQYLVFCFELLCHALTLCKLTYQPIKHILGLLVYLGKVSGEFAFSQQICVEKFTIVFQITKPTFTEYGDFDLRLVG